MKILCILCYMAIFKGYPLKIAQNCPYFARLSISRLRSGVEGFNSARTGQLSISAGLTSLETSIFASRLLHENIISKTQAFFCTYSNIKKYQTYILLFLTFFVGFGWEFKRSADHAFGVL